MADDKDALTWITTRYGAPTVERRSVLFNEQALVSIWIAAVRVYNGISLAAGPTKDDALTFLKMELRGELKNIELPLL